MDGSTKPEYKQYESGSESDTSSVTSEESLITSVPNFVDFAKQLAYKKSLNNNSNTYYHPYTATGQVSNVDQLSDQFNPILKAEDSKTPGLAAIDKPKGKEITTLFLIDSKNRDKAAFPQPTSFTLKPPRVYKNVVSIQVTQIKLLSSFFYFRTDKGNTILPVIERGREAINTYLGYSLTDAIAIREGTYGINDLLTEIQTQMNYTPVFYDFPGYFSDFVALFTINGDLSINFNQPGDTYYDALNSKFIQNPTINSIVSYYWGSRYAGLSSYSIDQVKNAYYYPVLYEALLDKNDKLVTPNLILTVPNELLATGESVYSHVIFNSSGLDDAVVIYLINQNIALLDLYRLQHTFRYSLVNRYQLAYDTNTLRVNIVTQTLNTSLVNLVNNTASATLASILNVLNLTTAGYSNLNSSVNRATVVYTDMYNFLQSQFTKFCAIPYATYSSEFFNDVNNVLFIQNGINAIGIRTGYTSEYLVSGDVPLTRSIQNTLGNSPGYWPNFTFAKTNGGANGGGIDLSGINVEKYMIPYSIPSKNFQFGNSIIDSSNYYINTNKSSRSVDAVITIKPAKYTVFKFRSPARQTLQVETLPLPYYYRFADYNKKGLYKGVLDLSKNNVPQKYFDISYSYVYNQSNSLMDSSNYSTIKLTPAFGTLFNPGLTGNTISVNSQSNYYQFEFIAPYPSGISTGIYAYPTNLSFVSMTPGTTLSTLYTDVFNAYIYHDRAAFMADLQFPRSENQYHYIQLQSTVTTMSDLTLHFSTFAGHRYYGIFRSQNVTCSNTTVLPTIYYNNSNALEIKTDYVKFDPRANPFDASNSSNYPFVATYNTDFNRLPTMSSLYAFDPNNSTFSHAVTIQGTPIGYDISGVSNDLTDYMGYVAGISGFVPNTLYNIDPLSYYTFQNLSPFDSIKGTYFSEFSLNNILQPITNDYYTYKQSSTSQIKIVHWYDGYSLPQQVEDKFTTFSSISISVSSNVSEYLPGFPVNSNGDVQFGQGVNAIGFLPTDGLYKLDSFTFKSCIYPTSSITMSSEDPNSKIAYIGVFTGLALTNTIINLSSAVAVLEYNTSYIYNPLTINRTPGFGIEYGTWYEYIRDPTFENSNISGYTPNNTELLSYNSMYYMVPFDSNGSNLTYSRLSGSLLPYPLSQTVSTGTTFYGQVAQNTPGANSQPIYIIPSTIGNANPDYGPQGTISEIQSQYQQSMPITTTSIGYKEYRYLANDSNALFSFNTDFSSSSETISSIQIGKTTFLSEYNNTLYSINSLSNAIYSNAPLTFIGASYASSISTSVSLNNGSLSCIQYLVSTTSTLQNYDYQSVQHYYSTIEFQTMEGNDTNITTQSFELTPLMQDLTLWLWGGGGSTWQNPDSITGGAGAYVQASIDVQGFLDAGISTLYFVVGKGGNRDNFSITPTTGIVSGYNQIRYGGGGTSFLNNTTSDNDAIALQGGGFTGIFTDSNLLYARPLLIVGGGGAAGAYNLGGPGGFGIMPPALEIDYFTFSTISLNATHHQPISISSIIDINSNAVFNGSNINYAFDMSFLTYWDPVAVPYMNPTNYNPIPKTYGLQIQFHSNVSNLGKLRYYGPPVGDSTYLPTGFIVYTSMDKSQVLYSNLQIKNSNYQQIENGEFTQYVYDLLINPLPTDLITRNAYIAIGGLSSNGYSSMQYSFDGRTWANINPPSTATSIEYFQGAWYYGDAQGKIYSSSDGFNWTLFYNTGNTNIQITSVAKNGSSVLAFGYSSSNGSGIIRYTVSSGVTMVPLTTNPTISRVRYINSAFWIITNNTLLYSSDGQIDTWKTVSNVTVGVASDIAYGVGRYVLVQSNTFLPYLSGILYSEDGITWILPSQVNIGGFQGATVVYANSQFVAGGSTTDGSSFMKYSIDGVNWRNTNYPNAGDTKRTEIQYINGKYISLGNNLAITGSAVNQKSIITSTDGINWSYSLTGGFIGNPSINRSISYGQITVPLNLSTLYMEIQKTDTSDQAKIYEINAYDIGTPITTDTSPLFDNSIESVFYPSESDTTDILNYPFTLTFSTVVSSINVMQFYVPLQTSALFTGISIQTAVSTNIVYANSNISSNDFIIDKSGTNYYEVLFVPPISNVSTLYMNLNKATLNSIQIYEIKALYDSNLPSIDQVPSTIVDLDGRSPVTLKNIIGPSLSTTWSPPSFIIGDSIKLEFTFSNTIDMINRVQIYSGQNDSNIIDGIYIYSDSSKEYSLYSNDSPSYTPYLDYNVFDLTIIELQKYSTIYLELTKNTPGIPILNQIKFYTIGLTTDITNGFSAGIPLTMQRTNKAYSDYDGGGGDMNTGGYGGIQGYNGQYLIGGSPVIAGNQLAISSFTGIENGAGGGGGGYYGGGGGGINIDGTGGAGGGGAGYLSSSLISILQYSIASPQSNNVSPGISDQIALSYSNVIPLNTVYYGDGGQPDVDMGMGSHGIVIMNYGLTTIVGPTNSNEAIPTYIDGSKLCLFETPILYNTDNRNLSFTTYSDSIETTSFAGYNWVWYSSYLSMVGGSLSTSMEATITDPSEPIDSFPSLPSSIYSTLTSQFSNVTTFYNSPIDFSTISTVSYYIDSAFTDFQNNYFIKTSAADSNYVEMTEIYCLLDYMRDFDTLANPHINPATSRIDRIFGGIPRFGYWANPFLTNVSYIGFDVGPSQPAPSTISEITGSSDQVQAFYGLVMEQSLETGIYTFKDIMAYKPTVADGSNYGESWVTITQFPESYIERSLTNTDVLEYNIEVQPYTMKNAISGRLSLFNYRVYSAPATIDSIKYDVPIQIINDFHGEILFAYSFQNTDINNISTVSINQLPFTSTSIALNQTIVTQKANTNFTIMGTITSEYPEGTYVNAITKFGFNGVNYIPVLEYSSTSSDYYNTYINNSEISQSNVGKSFIDGYGNYYVTDNMGSYNLYENICTTQIYQKAFINTTINYASQKYIATEYDNGNTNPYSDIILSKYTNIWHCPSIDNISTLYGARLNSPYDFNLTTNFANQIFYPTHKIVLEKVGSLLSPITDQTDLTTYPSYPHTEMFYYKSYTNLMHDINGQFALENSNNFAQGDMFSGYFFDSYIHNINLSKSTNFSNDDPESFNYLAIRGYSPSESFQALIRFYLPGRYDFGYISLKDLSNEIVTLEGVEGVNPEYTSFLSQFNASFSTTKVFGSTGVSGFSGSNISSIGFGDFLRQFNTMHSVNTSNTLTVSTINGLSNTAMSNLITGDLRYILPSYLTLRHRITDPLEFSIPFSTVVASSNRSIQEYGLGYNLGYSPIDTPFNTIQRAGSFFKILDDYIYLQMNPEFNMNRLDISKQEDFAQTHDTTAQAKLYNCKLILNNFGTYATTFVQNPVNFNPTIGKLDKLSFSWYDVTGSLINNLECEWSGAVQIVESVDVPS